MGKKTPFYRGEKIQPLSAQPAVKRYYRSIERYYRLSGTTTPRPKIHRVFNGSAAEAVLPLPQAVLPLRGFRPGEAAVVEAARAVVPYKAVLPF